MIKSVLISFFIVFCVYGETVGQLTYEIDPKYPVHALEEYLLVYQDSSGNMELDDVINLDMEVYYPVDTFVINPDQEFKYLDPRFCYWTKINLRTSQSFSDWYLQLEGFAKNYSGWTTGNGKVDVFGIINDKVTFYKKTGVDYPVGEKEVKSEWNRERVLLSMDKGDSLTIYIRIESSQFGIPPYFHLHLRKPGYEYFKHWFSPHNFTIKAVWGILVMAFFYHILLYAFLRDKVYLWFSTWLAISLVANSISLDFDPVSEYLLGNFPRMRLILWTLASGSVWFAFWFFGRSFVNTKKKYPIIDKGILALISFISVELLAVVLYMAFTTIKGFSFHYIFLSLWYVVGIVIAILLAIKQDKLARYFGIGAVFANLAPLVGGFWAQGLIYLPFDPFTWGIICQVAIYSIGLVYRRQQKDLAFKQAQKDLLEAEKSKVEMKRIKDLDEVKSRFFANISHEFRTPLSLILGPLQTQAKSDDNVVSMPKKDFQMIHRNANRLQGLVNQLLDLSKLESGKMFLQLKPGKIISFIRTMVYSFESLADKKNINLHTSFPEEINEAYFDKDKIEKIITNLISNAIKYTPRSGTVSVIIDSDEKYLTAVISDTGRGMDNEELEKIFERFYRIEGTEEVGSGIGLALTKELVELHNGSISVDSVKGQGTSFRIRIPVQLDLLPGESIVLEHKVSDNFENKPDKELFSEPHDIVSKNNLLPLALVVEDNEDLRYFIRDHINDSYQVITADNGIKGETLAKHQIPDIIISDVMMPGKNGLELCNTLKSDPTTSHIPIILLTAKAGQSNKMEGLGRGADAYLTKPFDVKELRIRMNNLIEARKKIWEQFKASGLIHLPDLELTSLDDQLLQKVHEVIQTNLANEQFTVEDLAKAVGFSRSQLHRKLKGLVNKSANQLIREVRLAHAKKMLESNSLSVSEIAYAVGYNNLSYFSKTFKEVYGVLPSEM